MSQSKLKNLILCCFVRGVEIKGLLGQIYFRKSANINAF